MSDEWNELAEANGLIDAVIRYLPILRSNLPSDVYAPLHAMLTCRRRPPTPAEIERAQEVYAMLTDTHGGSRREVLIGEQAAAFAQGVEYRRPR